VLGRINVLNHLLGYPPLLRTGVEDLRSVDRPDDLFTEICTMSLEPVLQQASIRKPFRVEDNFDRFGVATAVVFGRIRAVTPHPANPSGDHSSRVT
jgi:hypothetical protein